MNAKIRHHLAELLETERCIPVSLQEIARIRNGVISQNKLRHIVATMKAEGCGVAHSVTTHPPKTLSLKHYSVFKVDSSHDNVFHAFLHGVSFVLHHKPATATMLKRSTKGLRTAVVETVLKDSGLQNAMAKNESRQYQRQFEVRYGSEGKRAFSEYSRKMQSTAFGSFTEIAALAIHSGIELHVYDEMAHGYTFVVRYTPNTTATKKKRYVIRLIRRPRSHFDVLLPKAFLAHHGFWGKVNTHVLGRLGGNTVNSASNALAKLQARKSNANDGMNGNNNRLPNENVSKKNNFTWNNSPKLGSNTNNNTPKSTPSK